MNVMDSTGPDGSVVPVENPALATNFPWKYTPTNGFCKFALNYGDTLTVEYSFPERRGGMEYLANTHDASSASPWYYILAWMMREHITITVNAFGVSPGVNWDGDTGHFSNPIWNGFPALLLSGSRLVHTYTIVDTDTMTIARSVRHSSGDVIYDTITSGSESPGLFDGGGEICIGYPPLIVLNSSLTSGGGWMSKDEGRYVDKQPYMTTVHSIVKTEV